MLMMTVTVAFCRIALLRVSHIQSVLSSSILFASVPSVGRCAFEHLFAVPYSGLVAGSIPGGLVSTALEAIHGVMLFI